MPEVPAEIRAVCPCLRDGTSGQVFPGRDGYNHHLGCSEEVVIVATPSQPRLTIVPVYWREAKAFVAAVHRHHLPGSNGRFCIGVEDADGQLRGVAVLGRTKARMLPHKHVLEATRVATDGCPNACSALYAATCRLHKPHGYRKACTYILQSEPGTSLRAAGWKPVAVTGGGSWSRPSRGRDDQHPLDPKVRWECRCSELPALSSDGLGGDHEQG